MSSDAGNKKHNHNVLDKHESIFSSWRNLKVGCSWFWFRCSTTSSIWDSSGLSHISSQDREKEEDRAAPVSERQNLSQEPHQLPFISGSHSHL